MLRLELHLSGRVLRVSLSPRWQWGVCLACGCVILDAGPLALTAYTHRAWWDRP